ncbi:MAG TPA: type II toxin-antitoxin system VapC family toxin [Candidatus Dormibacteraeota bacterium]
MTYLLDTHVWLWMQAAPERLSDRVRKLIADAGVDLLFSAASSWEIAIKHSQGRLELPEPPVTYVPSRMRASGVQGLPIKHIHALQMAGLEPHHRDPFDRMLVAQAQVEGLTIITADPVFSRYAVPVLIAA